MSRLPESSTLLRAAQGSDHGLFAACRRVTTLRIPRQVARGSALVRSGLRHVMVGDGERSSGLNAPTSGRFE